MIETDVTGNKIQQLEYVNRLGVASTVIEIQMGLIIDEVFYILKFFIQLTRDVFFFCDPFDVSGFYVVHIELKRSTLLKSTLFLEYLISFFFQTKIKYFN